MKRHIINGLLAAGVVLAMAGCSENSWNDQLDGFDNINSGNLAPQSQTIEYTLTAADYKSIANNAENMAMAEAAGLSDELAAVATNGCLSDAITAEEYIPAWLNSVKANTKYPFYVLDNLSSVNITYNNSGDLSSTVKGLNAGKVYTVTSDEYLQAWGGNTDAYVLAFTPANPASAKLPAILKAAFPDAVANNYVAVNFNQASTEPEFKPLEITAIKDLQLNATVNVRATVTGVCTQGYTVNDGTGNLFVYAKSDGGVKIGQYVTVNGTIGCYNGGLQMATPTLVGTNGAYQVEYPEPEELTASNIDAVVAEFAAAKSASKGLNPRYVKITGTVVVSGNNVNFTMDGATGQGGIYGGSADLRAMFTNGETATITGYLVQVAGGRYCNAVVTHVNGTPYGEIATPETPKSEPAKIDSEAEVALFKYSGSAWAQATDATMLTHADYVALGQTHNNITSTDMLPAFLKVSDPYATVGTSKTLAYLLFANKTTTLHGTEYTFDGTEWTSDLGEAQAQFVNVDGTFKFQPEQDPEISTLEKNKNYTLRGQLTAICNQGAVLTLTTGSLLIYDKTINWSAYQVGDRVKVSATYTTYYGAPELTTATVAVTEAAAELVLPEVTIWTGADVDAWKAYVGENNNGNTTVVTAQYVEVNNVRVGVNASGYYYLYTDDGATYSLSFYQATAEQKDAFTDGETGVTVTGWAVSTGSAYVNFIPTKKNGNPIAPF